MRAVIACLIATPLLVAAFALPVAAQSNPSADQIVQSLKPSGNLLNGQTRGIRLAKPTAATAATPQAAAPAESASPSAGPSVDLSVEFASGSADLTPQAMKTLDQLGRALTSQDLAQYKFRIEGHTDTVGTPAANKSLSQRRAEAVAAYLEKTYGITAGRLESIGMGEDGLKVATPPQTANAQNRRVKVVNLGA
jgi:OOP family OmpA-OmpF porin